MAEPPDWPQGNVEPNALWERLKRQKLATWTVAYVTSAAALFGTLETIGDVFDWPPGVMRAVFFLLLAGLAATLLIAWYHGERGRQRVTAGEALLLAGVAALGMIGATTSLRGSRGGPVAAEAGLVVRPFTDTSPDGDQAYLGLGIAEEIRRALSVREGVPIPRAATAVFPGAHVLDGSVQRIGEIIRVAARLTDPSGSSVWNHQFEVPVERLFDVEDEIVDEVARRVGAPEASARPAGPALGDPEAHDAYLRGEHALRQRTPASVIAAIGQYRAASTRDLGFAAALAREAYAYAIYLDWGWTYPGLADDELRTRGIDLYERALAIDSVSPEGWLAKAYLTLLADPLHPATSLPAFSRAVDLDPANPEAQHQYGQTLMSIGRYAEAKAAYHAALAIDPERPMTLVPLSAIAHREGDHAAARRWADSAVALARDAPYPWASRGMLEVGLGEAEAGRRDAERALEIDPSLEVPARSTLAAALHTSGDRAHAEEELARARHAIVRPDRPAPTEVYYLAAALLHMGRSAEALDLIDAARPRSPWLWFYLESPDFDVLRDDPRFQAVIEASYADRPRRDHP